MYFRIGFYFSILLGYLIQWINLRSIVGQPFERTLVNSLFWLPKPLVSWWQDGSEWPSHSFWWEATRSLHFSQLVDGCKDSLHITNGGLEFGETWSPCVFHGFSSSKLHHPTCHISSISWKILTHKDYQVHQLDILCIYIYIYKYIYIYHHSGSNQ